VLQNVRWKDADIANRSVLRRVYGKQEFKSTVVRPAKSTSNHSIKIKLA
jgi:hypothetical protein